MLFTKAVHARPQSVEFQLEGRITRGQFGLRRYDVRLGRSEVRHRGKTLGIDGRELVHAKLHAFSMGSREDRRVARFSNR